MSSIEFKGEMKGPTWAVRVLHSISMHFKGRGGPTGLAKSCAGLDSVERGPDSVAQEAELASLQARCGELEQDAEALTLTQILIQALVLTDIGSGGGAGASADSGGISRSESASSAGGPGGLR